MSHIASNPIMVGPIDQAAWQLDATSLKSFSAPGIYRLLKLHLVARCTMFCALRAIAIVPGLATIERSISTLTRLRRLSRVKSCRRLREDASQLDPPLATALRALLSQGSIGAIGCDLADRSGEPESDIVGLVRHPCSYS